MAENCSVLDPWTHQYPYAGITDPAFARHNDALARALRISLFSDSSYAAMPAAVAAVPSPESLSGASSSFLFPPSGDASSRRRVQPAGRVAKKRKSRASKRSPTTYITADPANFRELVQRVTGTRSDDAEGISTDPTALPPSIAAAAQGSRLLPTLNTSALSFDEAAGLVGSVGPFLGEFDPFFLVPSFPTLDSWGAL
ncbi:calmodulin-binding protein 25-like [Canna indica]|uniref:Calmodulin-binding protein 25-like n=1 Tax=Canna indica TaxID=4628 RepID=A0AAQ3QMA1_9LILI|nr:calmodulin-binding protein 25-like [Canna indica]